MENERNNKEINRCSTKFIVKIWILERLVQKLEIRHHNFKECFNGKSGDYYRLHSKNKKHAFESCSTGKKREIFQPLW